MAAGVALGWCARSLVWHSASAQGCCCSLTAQRTQQQQRRVGGKARSVHTSLGSSSSTPPHRSRRSHAVLMPAAVLPCCAPQHHDSGLPKRCVAPASAQAHAGASFTPIGECVYGVCFLLLLRHGQIAAVAPADADRVLC
jgi:hypothetical protein